jgi:hypothetical protein
MIVALLVMLVASSVSGYMMTTDGFRDAKWIEESMKASQSGPSG